MKKTTKTLIVTGLTVLVVGLIIMKVPAYFAIMKRAPPGIHGLYSVGDYGPIYKTKYEKDSLLKYLGTDGLVIKSGRLNDYDPPWDSLRYLIANIRCDTDNIEPYIEFRTEKKNDFTTFRILWINATPSESYDTTMYRTMTRKYYNCVEAILKRHGVQLE